MSAPGEGGEIRPTCEPKCHAWGIGCACSGPRIYRHPGPTNDRRPGEGGGLVERIAAVLADHGRREVWEPPGNMIGWGCRCGWGSGGGYALPAHEAHVAAELLALVQAEQAAALADGWDEGCSHAGGPDAVPCPQNPYRERADRIERGE